MANDDQEQRVVMREFVRPMIEPSTSCIRLGNAARNYVLKGIHYNMLPSFYGMANEDSFNFMREFYGVVKNLPLQELNEDH